MLLKLTPGQVLSFGIEYVVVDGSGVVVHRGREDGRVAVGRRLLLLVVLAAEMVWRQQLIPQRWTRKLKNGWKCKNYKHVTIRRNSIT
jgi:hypothetical protein